MQYTEIMSLFYYFSFKLVVYIFIFNKIIMVYLCMTQLWRFKFKLLIGVVTAKPLVVGSTIIYR